MKKLCRTKQKNRFFFFVIFLQLDSGPKKKNHNCFEKKKIKFSLSIILMNQNIFSDFY